MKIRISLLAKISGASSVFLFLALLALAVMNIRSIQISSFDAAVLMGRNKLKGDVGTLEYELNDEYGQFYLEDGDLVNQQGNSLKHNYRIIDQISSRLGVHATIFVREGEDYRRITTSIIDSSGNRAVDTFLGSGSVYTRYLSCSIRLSDASMLGLSSTARMIGLLAAILE